MIIEKSLIFHFFNQQIAKNIYLLYLRVILKCKTDKQLILSKLFNIKAQ